MIDQVRSLNNRGVSAAILSSNKGIDKDLVATAKEVSSGKYFLLYTAPEAVVEDHCWRIHFLLYQRVNLFYVLKNHAQIQSIPGLVGDLAFNWRRIGLGSRLGWNKLVLSHVQGFYYLSKQFLITSITITSIHSLPIIIHL